MWHFAQSAVLVTELGTASHITQRELLFSAARCQPRWYAIMQRYKCMTRRMPCQAHAVEAGMKDCSSTLDGDPFTRCRKKVKVGELFCDCHKPFPDQGRRAAIYGDECM